MKNFSCKLPEEIWAKLNALKNADQNWTDVISILVNSTGEIPEGMKLVSIEEFETNAALSEFKTNNNQDLKLRNVELESKLAELESKLAEANVSSFTVPEGKSLVDEDQLNNLRFLAANQNPVAVSEGMILVEENEYRLLKIKADTVNSDAETTVPEGMQLVAISEIETMQQKNTELQETIEDLLANAPTNAQSQAPLAENQAVIEFGEKALVLLAESRPYYAQMKAAQWAQSDDAVYLNAIVNLAIPLRIQQDLPALFRHLRVTNKIS